jgi:small subunit ribosomal protein S20
MANNKSALKRILINKRNRLENRFYKSSVRTLTKLFRKQLEVYKTSQIDEDKKKAEALLNSIYSLIDKGCKKNVFHKNTGARKKSKLALQLKTVYLP